MTRCYPNEHLWVVWTPDGFPMGCMNMGPKSGEDPTKAAKEFWQGSDEALQKLAAGYRIDLQPWRRWREELLPIHLGKPVAS